MPNSIMSTATMPKSITLYRLPKSFHFSLNAIARSTRRDWVTLVAGECDFDNGDGGAPGAHDTLAVENRIALLLPFNTDRSTANDKGWVVGDLARVTGDGGITPHHLPLETIVQFSYDDGSNNPWWIPVDTGLFPRYVSYNDIERITTLDNLLQPDGLPLFVITKNMDGLAPAGTIVMRDDHDGLVRYTVLYGNATFSNGINKRPGFVLAPSEESAKGAHMRHIGAIPPTTDEGRNPYGWAVGDVGVLAGGEQVVRLADDDNTPCPPFQTLYDPEGSTPEKAPHRLLHYLRVTRLDPDMTKARVPTPGPTPPPRRQFAVNDTVIATAHREPRSSRPDTMRGHYFGTHASMERWEEEQTLLTVTDVETHDEQPAIRAGVGSRGNYRTFLFHPSELRISTPTEDTVPEAAEPPAQFTVGDIVTPSGHRYSTPYNDHFFGSNDTMERWEEEEAHLIVLNLDTSDGSIEVGDQEPGLDRAYWYHPTELTLVRSASTPDDPAEYEPLPSGTIIKSQTGHVMVVTNGEPDDDGEIQTVSIHNSPTVNHVRVQGPTRQPYQVMGRINEDGSYEAA